MARRRSFHYHSLVAVSASVSRRLASLVEFLAISFSFVSFPQRLPSLSGNFPSRQGKNPLSQKIPEITSEVGDLAANRRPIACQACRGGSRGLA